MVAPALIASLLLALPVQHAEEVSPRAWIGVSLSESEGPGLEITSVFEGSPAARAGIEAGDRLMSIGGDPIASYEQLQDRMRGERPGDSSYVWVRRDVPVVLDADYRLNGRPRLGVMLSGGAYPGMLEITGVEGGSPADAAGLREGDQLRELAGEGTPTVGNLQRALAKRDGDHEVVASISRRLPLEFGAPPKERVRRAPAPERRGAEQRLREIERERARMAEERGARRFANPAPQRGFRFTPRESGDAELRAQLESLADDLRALRFELGELRRELESLRDGR